MDCTRLEGIVAAAAIVIGLAYLWLAFEAAFLGAPCYAFNNRTQQPVLCEAPRHKPWWPL